MSSRPARPSIFRDLRRSWPGLLISLVCLVAVFSIADLGELRDSLAFADYRYFPAALLVFLLAFVTRAHAWRILLEGAPTPVQTFFALNEGYLLNNLLPFRLGEVGRAFLLGRAAGIDFLKVMSSIVVERVIDLSMVVSILLISLSFVVGAGDWARPAALSMAAVLAAALVVLYLTARNREAAMRWFRKVQERIPVLQRFGAKQLDAFFEGLSALTDLRRFLSVILLLGLTWLLVVVHYYLVLIAFHPGAGFSWAAFGIGVVGLGVAVPAAPGSIGVVQGVIVAVFPPLFGVDPSLALAYSITVHSIYLVVTSVLGLAGLVRDGQSLGTVYSEVRTWMQGDGREEEAVTILD